MSAIFFVSSIIITVLLTGCQSVEGDTMALLDEKVQVVHISKSQGLGKMNTKILQSFPDEKSLSVFEKAITNAQKQSEKIDVSEPEYDMMVEYESGNGEKPTHGFHLWLGEENEKSTLMYIEDDEVYLTTPAITKKLRALLIEE